MDVKTNQSHDRISLLEEWEVLHWMKTFGVSDEELREAVRKVGDSADAVGEYLSKKRPNRQHVMTDEL